MKVLNITDMLPGPIEPIKEENDILFTVAHYHCSYYPEASHRFILIIPFASYFSSFFSKKWNGYYLLRKKRKFSYSNYTVETIPLPRRGYRFNVTKPFIDWLGYFIHKKRLLTIIQKEKPDILHAHNVYHTAYIAQQLSLQTGIPYVVTARKIETFKNSSRIKEVLQQAAAVISINFLQKKAIDQLVLPKKSYLLPHGLDDAFLNNTNPARNQNTVVKLVSLCRLIPLKNIDTVIMALAAIDRPFVYHIYGEGPERERLERLVYDSKIRSQITFMGRINHDKVPGILSNYDMFIMPSFPETFGRVFLEAMSQGLTIVAAKNSGIDGYIKHGVSGFLVTPNHIKELETLLADVLQNHEWRKQIGEQAWEIAQTFSWRKITNQLETIYQTALIKQAGEAF